MCLYIFIYTMFTKIINSLSRNIGAPTYFYYILDELQKLFQNDETLKGKPHLGLYYSYKFGDIFRNVPESKMNIFIENYKKFNSTHIFSNQFSNNSGLDKKVCYCILHMFLFEFIL